MTKLREVRWELDICFIILHYIVYEETIKCIASIKKNIDSRNYKIVVVDNASPNKSGIILKNKYKEDDIVTIISMNHNIGFAKGNNIGIDYCRQNYSPNFICCFNNDIRLLSRDFVMQIKKEYGKSKCAVMGPRIYLKNHDLFSFHVVLNDVQHYKSLKDFYQNIISGDNYAGEKNKIERHKILRKIGLLNLSRGLIRGMYFKRKNVILHGCALIFTPRFFENYNGFNDRTFLFMEEQLLFYMCRKKNLNTVYNPKIIVRHMEDQATDAAWGVEDDEKRIIKTKYMMDSLCVLIEEMEQK